MECPRGVMRAICRANIYQSGLVLDLVEREKSTGFYACLVDFLSKLSRLEEAAFCLME